MIMQEKIVRFVTMSNWMLLGLIAGFSALLASRSFTVGVICGGSIVTVNFHLLARTLKKAFQPSCMTSYQSVIAKYYLRFVISGVVIFIILASGLVNPLGLILGLSVVAASFMLATLLEIKKLIFKEAV